MNIAFLLERFIPYEGGIPQRAYKIAKGLAERAHNIIVYTAAHPAAPSVEQLDGITVKRHRFIGKGHSPFVRLAKAPHGPLMPKLFMVHRDKEMQYVDIVQSFMFMSNLSLIAAFLKLSGRRAFVLAPYCPPDYRGVPGFSAEKSFSLYRLTLGKAVLRYADHHIVETETERNNLVSGFQVERERIQVIPDGVDCEAYDHLPDPSPFKETYGIRADSKVILFVGFPTKMKGLPHLLQAMKRIIEEIKDATLLLVGPKPHRAHSMLAKLASSMVQSHTVIAGYVSDESLLAAYSAADVLVLPSLLEGFGRVLVEAAAAGLPIVCTKTGAASDIVHPRENGLFVKYGNVDQISAALITILRDANFKREAQKRRATILKDYNSEKEIDLFEKTYQHVSNHTQSIEERK